MWAVPALTSNATSSTLGLIQLDGDLSGSATSPRVASIQGVGISGMPISGEALVATGNSSAIWGTVSGTTDWTNIKTAPYSAVGDGVTDDTTAFNMALIAAAGKTLFIPSGTYSLTPGVLVNIPTGTKIMGSGMGETILQVKAGFNATNDLIQVVSVSNVEISCLTLDGNRANNSGNQYGLYISSSSNCSAHELLVQNWNGDGVQLYNSTACIIERVWSTDKLFHEFEIEQCNNCTITASRGFSNGVHGCVVTPGEQNSQGAHGNTVTSSSFDNNANYGICVTWDNGNTGNQLSYGNKFTGNSVTENAQYGVCFFGESQNILVNNYIFSNGYFGLYGY
jgi:parallel beta-helix repeat protein